VEDETAVTALVPTPGGGRLVAVNGKSHSWLPFGGTHTRLGSAPALVHSAPADVAIIGLGSGDTAWAAGCRRETRSVTVFEIAAGQPPLLARAAASGAFPDLAAFLRDPRLHVVVEDGRKALQDARDPFDLIEADALWPRVAGSGYLYSVEFFELCARRLKPGGVACTWSPTDRVYKSFTTAFPHVIGLADHEILIGSNDPLEVDRDLWRQRLADPAVQRYLGARQADAAWLLDRLQPLHRAGRGHRERELNRDLFPRDEFWTP
jgi:spermidine synthase